MTTLVAWILILVFFIWSTVRVKTHARLMEKWPVERYNRFRHYDEIAVRSGLIVAAVLFCWGWVFNRPPYIPAGAAWAAVFLTILTISSLFYHRVYSRLWLAVKELFRKVDRRDLKYRVRLHFIHASWDLYHYNPRTWAVLMWVTKLFKRKG